MAEQGDPPGKFSDRFREWLAAFRKRSHPGNYPTLLALVAGVSIVFVGSTGAFTTWALALAAGTAAFMAGGLLGFIFGIPRYAAVPGEERVTGAKPLYRANTNLEQISDWLTKALVGIGLTQALPIARKVGDISVGLARGLSNGSTPSDADRALALGLILVTLTCGFLFFYLWSRLALPRLFGEAENPPRPEDDIRLVLAEVGTVAMERRLPPKQVLQAADRAILATREELPVGQALDRSIAHAIAVAIVNEVEAQEEPKTPT